MSLEQKAWRLAEKYRRGDIAEDALDSLAKTLTGYHGDTIRQMARQLDDWKQFKKVLCNDDDPNFRHANERQGDCDAHPQSAMCHR